MEATALDALLRARVVHEAAPGAYYLEESGRRPRWMTKRRLAGLLFALLVVLLLAVVVIGAIAG